MAGTLNKGSLIKSSGGSGGGGSASFPTIVTDSGSSLPVDLTGYSAGDTFLNTSDKKIYTAGYFGYELNTNVTNTATLDNQTGVVSGFGASANINKRFVGLWTGNEEYIVKFTITSINNNNSVIIDLQGNNNAPGSGVCFCLSNKKLHYIQYREQYGDATTVTDTEISDYVFETNKLYTLNINKEGTSCNVVVLEENSSVINKTIDTVNLASYPDGFMTYGSRKTSQKWYFSGLEVYLSDSSGEFLVPSSTLSWDSGTSITDKTEYADKTNGALYLYENSELVKIGGSLTKKVYTISADNTSTLDVSSDFTKVVDVLKNGVELALTDDYTISSGVITFVTALSTTDKITVKGE